MASSSVYVLVFRSMVLISSVDNDVLVAVAMLEL